MTSLNDAHLLAKNIEAAKSQFETYLSDTLQAYIDFLPERGASWIPEKYKDASDYSFREIDGTVFVFESAEYEMYGDYEKDIIELPFDFVDDPETFKKEVIELIASEARRNAERNRAAAQTRIDNLKRQLEVAERALKS